MSTRVLNAATDGETSEWEVPLDSGPAAAADHATVIVTFAAPASTPGTAAQVGVAEAGAALGSGDVQQVLWSDNGPTVAVFNVVAYRRTSRAVIGFTAAGGSLGGDVRGGAPPTSLLIRSTLYTFGDNTWAALPIPAGGRVEVWVG